MSSNGQPVLSVIIPTFQNCAILQRCLESWQAFAGTQPIELLVIEDACRDGTADFLRTFGATSWGQRHLRWFHEDNVHELRCTNRGFREARGDFLLTWHDDMFVRRSWLVPELLATFAAYSELGLLSLSRGLLCKPVEEPIQQWEDLTDWRRLESTIGPAPANWFCLQEIDVVIRPWMIRRACLDQVGLLDEAFCPTEWDEADLCFRVRQGGWKTATHGFERLGAYEHLGSSTLNRTFSDAYKQRVLANGLLFHERWDAAIRAEGERPRQRWWRRSGFNALLSTFWQIGHYAWKRRA